MARCISAPPVLKNTIAKYVASTSPKPRIIPETRSLSLKESIPEFLRIFQKQQRRPHVSFSCLPFRYLQIVSNWAIGWYMNLEVWGGRHKQQLCDRLGTLITLSYITLMLEM